MSKAIRYIERAELDIQKWDKCAEQSDNGLIYARSWWLDGMAENWSGLVLNDYEAVMPLAWKKKYGFCYLYQPWFTCSLGVFKKEHASVDLMDFLKAIPPKFSFWDFQANEQNPITAENSLNVKVTWRVNHFVRSDVMQYDEISGLYSRLCRRKLTKAAETQLKVIVKDIGPEEIIEQYQKEYAKEHPAIRSKDYQRLANCCNIATGKGLATSYVALSTAGSIVGFYLVLHDRRFSYSLIGGSTAEGKEDGAFYLLTDAAIKHASENNRVFRFEGSDIPGIAFFNSQFGSVAKEYPYVRLNKLPFWAKLFKK